MEIFINLICDLLDLFKFQKYAWPYETIFKREQSRKRDCPYGTIFKIRSATIQVSKMLQATVNNKMNFMISKMSKI